MTKVLIAAVMVLSAMNGQGTQIPAGSADPTVPRASAQIMDGLLIHKVAPVYPEAAKKKHIEGDVRVLITVSQKGDVVGARAIQGNPVLVNAAIDAVKQWKYQPFMVNGRPIEVEAMVLMRFKK